MAAMDITFLGTASAFPTPHRGVSSTIFRYGKECWMIDCGECTQTQLMKSHIKSGKINRVFITHLHGDHLFGLPGLLCTLSQSGSEVKKQPIEIYGPEGLAVFLRVTLGYSAADLDSQIIINELVPTSEMLRDCTNNYALTSTDCCAPHPAEIPGRKIYADENGVWNLLKAGRLTVRAGPLRHRVPTFGYVIDEDPVTGGLDVERARQLGILPGSLFARLKKGESVSSPDGNVVNLADVVEPSRPGRKVVLLGDTCDSGGMLGLCTGADILVHETTFENAKMERALERTHSTPEMAAKFAVSAKVKKLVITHFSQRYKPEAKADTDEGTLTVQDLLAEAKAAFGSENVVAATDMLTLPISLS